MAVSVAEFESISKLAAVTNFARREDWQHSELLLLGAIFQNGPSV